MFGKFSASFIVLVIIAFTAAFISCSDSGAGGDDDLAPPDVIDDLTVTDFSSSSVTLSWTASGDDGTTGTATYYDLRYADHFLYYVNWDSAAIVAGEPIPQPAGSTETMTVTGLIENEEYYFAIKVYDDDDNCEGVSNCVSITCFDDSAVVFPDPNLEAAVRAQVGKPSGDILLSDLLAYDNLDADNMDIVSLAGLEAWNTLVWVELNENEISDLTPLSGLTLLTGINLWDNQIEDLSPLAGLINVTGLTLQYNQIEDLGPLSGLTALQQLNLHYNQISDIAPLVNNSGLGQGDDVWLSNNPLNFESVNTHLPALRSRGANVYVNEDNYAPYAIGDLEVSDVSDTSVILTWTATGDDIQTGTAYSYDIRYSTDSATLAGWTGAITVGNDMVPQVSGSSELFEIADLEVGNTYYFAVEARDEWNNWSDISNIVKATPYIDEVIVFPDAALETVIRAALSKPSGDIYRSELLTITQLSADSVGIADISGLEYCENIWSLDLGRNDIDDISALAGLTKITNLDIEKNNISDISYLSEMHDMWVLILTENPIDSIEALSEMTNLSFLSIISCNVTDLSPLTDMIGLQFFIALNNNIVDLTPLANKIYLQTAYLNYNDIVDVTPLQGLSAIQFLNLGFNQIADILPLVNNVGLGSGDELDLQGNPLLQVSIDTYIPALEGRGVTVNY